jgi:hypothetical protein
MGILRLRVFFRENPHIPSIASWRISVQLIYGISRRICGKGIPESSSAAWDTISREPVAHDHKERPTTSPPVLNGHLSHDPLGIRRYGKNTRR